MDIIGSASMFDPIALLRAGDLVSIYAALPFDYVESYSVGTDATITVGTVGAMCVMYMTQTCAEGGAVHSKLSLLPGGSPEEAREAAERAVQSVRAELQAIAFAQALQVAVASSPVMGGDGAALIV